MLLLGAGDPIPRFGKLPGRCMFALFPIGRCTPGFIEPGRCEPIPKPLCAARLPFAPARADGAPMWLTTGREKLRGGGAAALRLEFSPSMVVRVGRTPNECTGVIRLSWFGETRSELRATLREFNRVSLETAVNPFGARMFA